MTLREKLADWISGGALTRAREDRKIWFLYWYDKYAECEELEKRLRLIANQETPSANATVKRMASIARGEE